MNDIAKISPSHLSRAAYVYLRQSSPTQVKHNREFTERQYALVTKATALGWDSQQILVVDEDLGLSGTGIVERNGFARLTAEVALSLSAHQSGPTCAQFNGLSKCAGMSSQGGSFGQATGGPQGGSKRGGAPLH